MDVVSPGHPLLDIYLQTVEVLRDTSHVRNYAPGEWLALLTEAGLVVREVTSDRLMLEFGSCGAHAHAGAFRYRDPRAAAKRVAGGGGALRHSAGRLLYQRYHDV